MPRLDDKWMLTNFVKMLEKAEEIPDNILTDFEVDFIASIRDKFDARESQADLGIPLWNPSANQWNTLKLICEKW